jgi:5-methylcytosine-specific restriction endonuclease McrA
MLVTMPKSRKKRKAKRVRAKSASRASLILAIVATDNTFEIQRVGDNGRTQTAFWLGKCIHCNAKLYVDERGATDATVEHVMPLCNEGEAQDVRNLALACKGCNNEKGVRHDKYAGKGGRADEVINALQEKRMSRWREP